jgi:hypothetical protein
VRASINERFSDVRLTGVNIDERQLAVARQRVQARPGNSVDFIHADACELPFEDSSMDAVIAFECIFHFPSRRRFLREAIATTASSKPSQRWEERRALGPAGVIERRDDRSPEEASDAINLTALGDPEIKGITRAIEGCFRALNASPSRHLCVPEGGSHVYHRGFRP